MKNLVKILALFVFSSLVFSSFAGCSNSGTTPTGGNLTANANAQTVNTANSDSSANATKSEAKEVPAVIMQATIESLEGNNFKLEDKKGKIVLINLWGIWCAPCIREMPHLVELQEKYREQGFEIIGLNVGDENLEKESAENIKAFAEKMKLNYQLGWAEDKVYKAFLDLSGFPGVPQSFLLDREGKLSDIYLGGSPATLVKMKDKVGKLVEVK